MGYISSRAGRKSMKPQLGSGSERTSLSNTHLFSPLSSFRHCHNCWLLLSRHSQCFRNSSKHDLLMSSSLHMITHQQLFSISMLNASLMRCSAPPKSDLHTRRTPRNLPSLLQALNLPSAHRVRLALHEIVIVGLAPGANEEGSTQ